MVVAFLSAMGAAEFVPAGGGIAVGGPLPVHPGPASVPTDGPDDALALPGAPAVVAITMPAGPHLTVPILYYHYVRNIQLTAQNLLSWRLSIPPALFAQQMALLRVEGAHPITLDTLMKALAGQGTLPSRPIILTFDDGYADFATGVEPVLARYGFVATDFVVSGFINRPRYMSAAQVLQMVADGMVIGAHTVHHVDLAAVPAAVARTEIVASKSAIETLIRKPVLDFAYPYGAFDAAVASLVQQAGFRDAVTTSPGDQQTLNGRFVLQRIEVGGAPTLETFAQEANLPLPSVAQFAVIELLANQAFRARNA